MQKKHLSKNQHALWKLEQRLCKIENMIDNLMLEFKKHNNTLYINKLNCKTDENLQAKDHNEKCTLFNFIKLFISEVENSRAASTILQYKNTLRLLNRYAADVCPIDFQDIDLKFYANFRDYMNEAGYSETYFGNQIKFIRLFMNEATERGYNTNISYKSRKFLSPQLHTTKIYLTNEEIARIQQLELGGRKNLEKSRDMFIIACKTGLRFSDLIQLNPANFLENNKLLCISTQKTGTIVHIPLTGDVIEICRKYNYHLPAITNVTFNKHIREIGKLAGFSEMVEVTKQGLKDKNFIPKYKLITAHTARRSFATNAFLAKIPCLSIMKITGHSTEQAFMKYIRISGEDNARNLLLHPYFS